MCWKPASASKSVGRSVDFPDRRGRALPCRNVCCILPQSIFHFSHREFMRKNTGNFDGCLANRQANYRAAVTLPFQKAHNNHTPTHTQTHIHTHTHQGPEARSWVDPKGHVCRLRNNNTRGGLQVNSFIYSKNTKYDSSLVVSTYYF